jgi:hypothetical protein
MAIHREVGARAGHLCPQASPLPKLLRLGQASGVISKLDETLATLRKNFHI